MRTWVIFWFMAFLAVCCIIGFVFKHDRVALVYLIILGLGMGVILRNKGIIP